MVFPLSEYCDFIVATDGPRFPWPIIIINIAGQDEEMMKTADNGEYHSDFYTKYQGTKPNIFSNMSL